MPTAYDKYALSGLSCMSGEKGLIGLSYTMEEGITYDANSTLYS